MRSRTILACTAVLLAACGTNARDMVAERAGNQPSWSVPPHRCSAGTPQTEVGDDGTVTQFCHDGQSLEGSLVRWHPNAQKAAQGAYRSGRRTGTWAWWHDNGQLATRGEFVMDREEGEWTWWHENGVRAMAGDHVRGQRMGLWEQWYDDGKVHRRGHYRNGHETGVWVTYTREGEEKARHEYKHGKLVKEDILIEDEEPETP